LGFNLFLFPPLWWHKQGNCSRGDASITRPNPLGQVYFDGTEKVEAEAASKLEDWTVGRAEFREHVDPFVGTWFGL